MATRQLRKTEKQYAVEAIVEAKFKSQHRKLMARARDLAQRIYDETLGVDGHNLHDAAGPHKAYWLDFRASVHIAGMPHPELMVERPKAKGGLRFKDVFTGETSYWGVRDDLEISLVNSVPWPHKEFSTTLHADRARPATQRMVKTLRKHVTQFNTDVKEHYKWVSGLVMSLRTVKQVDEHFPELWQYLPEGTRQELKQAVVPFDQQDFDKLRKELPRGK